MTIVWLIIFLVISLILQPVWWIGFVREWLTGNKRLANDRMVFGSAVYQERYELRHYIVEGLLLGLLASLFSLVLGIMVPIEWWILYTVLAGLSLLLMPAAGAPVLVFASSVGLFFWYQNYASKAIPSAWLRDWGFNLTVTQTINFVAITTLILGLMSIWLFRVGGQFNSPKVISKRRGKRVAGFSFNELLVVPTLVLIPGDWLSSHWAFWPMLTLEHHRFTLLFLPLLIGLKWTFVGSVARQILSRFARQLGLLALVGVLLIEAEVWLGEIAGWCLLGLLVVYVIIVVVNRLLERRKPFIFTELDDGVRVIGIKPRTPAVKLDVQIGDVILECNHLPVNDENEFYRALQKNPTYCHLKVRDVNDQLKVSETAIFAGAPHEIGLVLFQS